MSSGCCFLPIHLAEYPAWSASKTDTSTTTLNTKRIFIPFILLPADSNNYVCIIPSNCKIAQYLPAAFISDFPHTANNNKCQFDVVVLSRVWNSGTCRLESKFYSSVKILVLLSFFFSWREPIFCCLNLIIVFWQFRKIFYMCRDNWTTPVFMNINSAYIYFRFGLLHTSHLAIRSLFSMQSQHELISPQIF